MAHFSDIYAEDENRDFYATFLTDSIRVAITRWLLEGAKWPPEEFVRLMKTAVTGVNLVLTAEQADDQSSN